MAAHLVEKKVRQRVVRSVRHSAGQLAVHWVAQKADQKVVQ
jgi:hypothetical protein